MRALAFGPKLFLRCAVVVLLAGHLPSPAGAQRVDNSVKSTLTAYAERMATLATRLDRASALAERASRIADPAQAPAAAPSGDRAGGASPGANAATLSADEVMAGLRQIVAQRTEVLQLAATVAAKLNGDAPGGAKPPAATRNNPGRKLEGSHEALIGLASDLAKADLKADVAAARSALEALRSAAQNAASRSWKNTPRATAAGLLPERIARDLAQGTGFGRMTIQDALLVHLALSSNDARADLQAVLAKATQENDRAYRAAVKANLALDSAIMDFGFAAAERQLRSRRAAASEPSDLAGMVRYMVGHAGSLLGTDVKDERKKLGEQLKELKGRKRQLVNQIQQLESQINALLSECEAAIGRVKSAGGGAVVGAMIGGFFGGPIGAAIGGAIGASAASPSDIAKLEECKQLAELQRQLDELYGELNKIDIALKKLLNELKQIDIASKKQEQEQRQKLRTDREGMTVSKPNAARLKDGDANVRRATPQDRAARTRLNAGSPVIERPCGTPDKPCRPAATSRAASPGGGSSAMDRLGPGGGMPATAAGGSRAGAAAGTRNPNAARPSPGGPSSGAAIPASSINRNAIGVSSPPERLR